MGSTIYTQKLKHPVYVNFTCEHCGQYNSFTQEIIAVSRTEVGFARSNKYTQQQISKLGPKAEADLVHRVQQAKSNTERGDYSWLKLHKCTKCNYTQSWQTGRVWKRSIKFFILDILIIYIFFSWLTGSSPESKTSGAWGFFAILGLLVLIPVFVLIQSLAMRDKDKRDKPDIRI